MTDDTTQAAKRLAEMFERPGVNLTLYGIDVSATIRSLVARAEKAEAERDRLRAERDAAKLQTAEAVVALNNRDRERMQAEREARAAEAERDAAIMDADMATREAGNMEYNARVLMTERTQLREAVEALMAADDYWLQGNKDNQWASMMAAARAKARVALGKDRQ
jgi:hypothetical protein